MHTDDQHDDEVILATLAGN